MRSISVLLFNCGTCVSAFNFFLWYYLLLQFSLSPLFYKTNNGWRLGPQRSPAQARKGHRECHDLGNAGKQRDEGQEGCTRERLDRCCAHIDPFAISLLWPELPRLLWRLLLLVVEGSTEIHAPRVVAEPNGTHTMHAIDMQRLDFITDLDGATEWAQIPHA